MYGRIVMTFVATENVIPTENVIHYIFGYYIFGYDRPTENVITENVMYYIFGWYYIFGCDNAYLWSVSIEYLLSNCICSSYVLH